MGEFVPTLRRSYPEADWSLVYDSRHFAILIPCPTFSTPSYCSIAGRSVCSMSSSPASSSTAKSAERSRQRVSNPIWEHWPSISIMLPPQGKWPSEPQITPSFRLTMLRQVSTTDRSTNDVSPIVHKRSEVGLNRRNHGVDPSAYARFFDTRFGEP